VRSLYQPTPEILGIKGYPPTSPLDRAQELVARWETELGHPHMVLPATSRITLTQDVRDKMASDIAAIINDTITREHLQPG
jgi:hypothetical protein